MARRILAMWYYNNEPLLEEHLEERFGFIYCITNILTGRKYIGKKLLTKAKTKTIKGKKKKTRVESDWKTYYGSNKTLLEDIEKCGKESFRRDILMLCNNRGECNYFEAKLQIDYGVLFSDLWYNDHIWVRVHRSHLKAKSRKFK